MMHSNDFVVAILYNGKFLEESKGGVVALPFGAEYTIRLRNKKNRKAVAKVFIDEENVSEGGVVVQPHNYVDLECHVGNYRKFKFVSVDSGEAIDAGKNNKSDDSNGIIRVEWRAEREYERPIYIDRPVPYPVSNPWRTWPYTPYPYPPICSYGMNSATPRGITGQSLSSSKECNFDGSEAEQPIKTCSLSGEAPTSRKLSLAEGCTVEGSASSQRFRGVHVDLEETITTIRITLRGYVEDKPLVQSFKSEHCEACGVARKSKKAKFCWNCGKGLTKVRSRV